MTPAASEHQPHLWPSAGPPAPPGTGTVRPSAGHWGRVLREPPTLLPVSGKSLEIISKLPKIVASHPKFQWSKFRFWQSYLENREKKTKKTGHLFFNLPFCQQKSGYHEVSFNDTTGEIDILWLRHSFCKAERTACGQKTDLLSYCRDHLTQSGTLQAIPLFFFLRLQCTK